MPRLWTPILGLVIAACAGDPAPVAAVAPPPGAVATLVPERSAEEQAFVDATRPWVTRVGAASTRCHALFDPLTPEAVRAAGFPFDQARLTEACGEIGGLYDSAVGMVAGQERATDVFLTHVARIGDDLDYTRRAFTDSADERVNALKHVHDALVEVDQAVLEWDASIHTSYTAAATHSTLDRWVRDLQNDGRALPDLRRLYGHLAFNQGYDKAMVRRRMLDSFLRVARRPVEARSAALDQLTDASERSARAAYQDVCTGYLKHYTSVLDAFVSGRVADAATHAARVKEADDALVEFRAAWAQELARVGATGG